MPTFAAPHPLVGCAEALPRSEDLVVVADMALWRASAHTEVGASGPYRDRTCDLEIKSLLLYQLS